MESFRVCLNKEIIAKKIIIFYIWNDILSEKTLFY